MSSGLPGGGLPNLPTGGVPVPALRATGHPFMTSFLASLTRGVSDALDRQQLQANKERNDIQEMYTQLAKSPNEEIAAAGLTGLFEAKGERSLKKLRSSPTYAHALDLMRNVRGALATGQDPTPALLGSLKGLLGGQAGGQESEGPNATPPKDEGTGGAPAAAAPPTAPPGLEDQSMGAMPLPTAGAAAQAPPTLSQEGSTPGGLQAAATGIAPAAAAPPVAPAPSAPVTQPFAGSLTPGGTAAGGMPSPTAPPAGPAPQIDNETAWAQTLKTIDSDQYRYSLSPQIAKTRTLLKTYHAAGATPKEAWAAVLGELAPNALRSRTAEDIAAQRNMQPKLSTFSIPGSDIPPGTLDALGQPIDPKQGYRMDMVSKAFYPEKSKEGAPKIRTVAGPDGRPQDEIYDAATNSYIPIKGGAKAVQNKIVMSRDELGNESPVQITPTFAGKPGAAAAPGAGAVVGTPGNGTPPAPGVPPAAPAPLRAANKPKMEAALKKPLDARMKDYQKAGDDFSKVLALDNETGADQATTLATAIRGSAGRFTPMEQKFFASGQGMYGPISVMMNRIAGGTEVVTPELIQNLKQTAQKQLDSLSPQWSKELLQAAKTARDQKLDVSHVVEIPDALLASIKNKIKGGATLDNGGLTQQEYGILQLAKELQ